MAEDACDVIPPDLVLKILNSTNSVKLQKNVNLQLLSQTGCTSVFAVWLDQEANDAVIQVVGEYELKEEIHISISGKDVMADAKPEELINLLKPAVELDAIPLPQKLDKFPMCHPDTGEVACIICLVDSTNLPASQNYVEKLLEHVRMPLITASDLSSERKRKEQSQALLGIARNLFLHLGDLVDLMQEIISEARNLTGAERCSLFLVSDDGTELIAKVFDGVPNEVAEEVRMPINQGIAGFVATTGETLNIRDAYNHPLFYKKLDEQTGFITRNILCFPIRDGQNRVVGVAQLCNKASGFTALDEEASAALATYCGISLMHSIVYKKIQQSQARSRLANELLMYHMAVSEESVLGVTQCTHAHDMAAMLDWRWPCREVHVDATPCLALSMFESLGFVASCRMDRNTLARFILLVRKGYREIPYHNWLHAFSTGHFVFCIMKSMELVEKSMITELEGVALLVAAFCHDLDHRGTTNSFQTKSKNTLACLYSSEGSVMEQHHFAQALCILNTDGCNIFEHLDTSSYRHVLDIMREMILATDIVSHLARRSQQQAVAASYDPDRRDHRAHLLALTITCADLSDQVKGWPYTRQIANLIYEEFFVQGDMEKAMGTQPAVMMDRERSAIPFQQVQFLTDICHPSYSLLALFFPRLEPCVWAIEDSLQRWRLVKKWCDLPEHEGRMALDLLNDPRLDTFVYEQIDL